MRVHIIYPPGGAKFTVEVESHDTLGDITHLASDYYGIHMSEIRFTKDGNLLRGWDKLAEYGIEDGDDLYLHSRSFRYIPPPKEIIEKVRAIQKLEDVYTAIRETHVELSRLKSKQIITETFLKFIPPSAFTTTMLLIGSSISGLELLFLNAMLVVIGFMVLGFILGYYFQVWITSEIYSTDLYLEQLLERRVALEEKEERDSRKYGAVLVDDALFS